MLLLITLVLALVPLLGVVWIIMSGSLFSVDGLFMILILLTMSGVVGMNVIFELRKGSRGSAGSRSGARAVAGGLRERGKVDNVVFYEGSVGQTNKSLVTLSDGAPASRLLVFSGDLRNSLPVGKKVEITYRQDHGAKVLLQVSYV
jgi:hypothetical protein